MRYKEFATYLSGLLLLVSIRAFGQEVDEPNPVSGKVGVAAKYNSNIELTSGVNDGNPLTDEEIESAWICEITALLAYASSWDSPWHLDLELFGTSDVHVKTPEDSWIIGRGNLDFGYDFGASSLSLLDEVRYFTEPDDTDFDNIRNSASLVFRHMFSPLWQLKVGLNNAVHHYFQDDILTGQG